VSRRVRCCGGVGGCRRLRSSKQSLAPNGCSRQLADILHTRTLDQARLQSLCHHLFQLVRMKTPRTTRCALAQVRHPNCTAPGFTRPARTAQHPRSCSSLVVVVLMVSAPRERKPQVVQSSRYSPRLSRLWGAGCQQVCDTEDAGLLLTPFLPSDATDTLIVAIPIAIIPSLLLARDRQVRLHDHTTLLGVLERNERWTRPEHCADRIAHHHAHKQLLDAGTSLTSPSVPRPSHRSHRTTSRTYIILYY
jgi:hypothetical protein